MENSTNNGKLIGALLLGAAIGGALGILFAPDKGSETRKKLLAKGNDLTDNMNKKLSGFLDEVKKEVESVKEKTSEFILDGAPKSDKYSVS